MANKDIKLTRKQLNLVTLVPEWEKIYISINSLKKNLGKKKEKSWEYVFTKVFSLHFILFCFCKGAVRRGRRGKKREGGFGPMFIVPKSVLFSTSPSLFSVDLLSLAEIFNAQNRVS